MKITFIMFVIVMHNIIFNGIYFSLMSVRSNDFVNWFDKNPRFGGGFLYSDLLFNNI